MGSALTDQNFTSVNEHTTSDGVYVLSFEFNKTSDTVQETLKDINLKPALFCGTIIIQLIKSFLEGKQNKPQKAFF